MRNKVFAALAILIGFALPLALGEVACRILPVSGGLRAMPVNADNPIFHFTPNRKVTWSRDWNFTIVNRIRVNNVGYVNDQDYARNDPRPLLAVIGDSYVEAAMLPYRETLQGRLAAAFAPAARVYSFGASGAPLSQYLVWAREARERWKAQALVIVVVGNDFDESLAMYQTGPGFHHYVVAADGGLALRRYDYEPGRLRRLARRSALVRYLLFNLQAHEHLRTLVGATMALVRPAHADPVVGNTSASADPERIRWSEAGVRAFFRDLREYAGWQPGQVAFVIDGIRYPTGDPSVATSYFIHMRNFFTAEARRLGYQAIDMDPIFFASFGMMHERFDYPSDGHWNGLAHALAADAVVGSALISEWRRGTSPLPRQ